MVRYPVLALESIAPRGRERQQENEVPGSKKRARRETIKAEGLRYIEVVRFRPKRHGPAPCIHDLHAKIGQLTVERDLARAYASPLG